MRYMKLLKVRRLREDTKSCNIKEKMSKDIINNKSMLRDSNYEMLRILCMFGIVLMHAYGEYHSTLMGVSRIECVFHQQCLLYFCLKE